MHQGRSRAVRAGLVLLVAASSALGAQAPPVYVVDPFWPRPLPNKWSMQQVVDSFVETKNDHVWFINRSGDIRPSEAAAATNPPRAECCLRGPEIIELDPEGRVVRAWDGRSVPGWPGRLQSMAVDRDGNVWISGTNLGDSLQKFSPDGALLWDFGHRWPTGLEFTQNNQQLEYLPGIEDFALDDDRQEIYIADGARNKRVLVFDMKTGAFKRGWGGHGAPLTNIDNDPIPPYDISGPPPELPQFVPALHCVHPSRDGLVYVCERGCRSSRATVCGS